MKLDCLFSLTGTLTGAASTLEESLRKDRAQADVNYVLAEVYTGLNCLPNAVFHLKASLDDKDDPALLENLEDLYATQWKYRQAVDTYARITSEDELACGVGFKLGVIQYAKDLNL